MKAGGRGLRGGLDGLSGEVCAGHDGPPEASVSKKARVLFEPCQVEKGRAIFR